MVARRNIEVISEKFLVVGKSNGVNFSHRGKREIYVALKSLFAPAFLFRWKRFNGNQALVGLTEITILIVTSV
jgi:hypothetical protein